LEQPDSFRLGGKWVYGIPNQPFSGREDGWLDQAQENAINGGELYQ
jgi:hypothetical protein